MRLRSVSCTQETNVPGGRSGASVRQRARPAEAGEARTAQEARLEGSHSLLREYALQVGDLAQAPFLIVAGQDLDANVDAFIANEHVRTRDQGGYVVLVLSAERAALPIRVRHLLEMSTRRRNFKP